MGHIGRKKKHKGYGHNGGRLHAVPDLSHIKRIPIEGRRQEANNVARPVAGVAVTPPRPPDLNLVFAQSWRSTYGDFMPTVSEAAYHQFVTMLLVEHHIEIAGIFHLNEATDTIDWFWRDEASKGHGGGVHSDDGAGIVAAMLSGVGVPNGQWHTHPGFGTFWSGTDLTDQGATVRDAMKISASGTTYFIVANALNWRVRKTTWADGQITLVQDGHVVRWDGFVLNYADKGQSWRSWKDDRPATAPAGQTLNGNGVVSRPTDEVYEEFGEDGYGYYAYYRGLANGNGPQRNTEHPLLLPAAVPLVRQEAVVWALKDVDYTELFAKFKVEEGEWDNLETTIQRQYPGMFAEIMAHPEWWPEL